MNSEQLTQILQQAFPQAQLVTVSGEGSKFEIRIVDEGFENKRLVARQQAVYAPLNEYIASGAVHAVTIKALTPEEHRKASLFGG